MTLPKVHLKPDIEICMKCILIGKASLKEITSFWELAHLILQERREQGHKNSSHDGVVED